jgi:hypothetical protein
MFEETEAARARLIVKNSGCQNNRDKLGEMFAGGIPQGMIDFKSGLKQGGRALIV